jgi:hypothetical protein
MAEPLGSTTVIIDADTTKLKEGVQEAKTEVEKLDKSGKTLGSTMAKAQAVMAKVFIPVAVAGAVAGVTQKVLSLVTSVQNLRLGFQDTEKAARSLVENARLNRLGKDAQEAVKVMQAFDAQIEAVRKQAEDFKASTAGFWLGIFGAADADALAAESIRNIQIAQTQAERELSRLRIDEARKVEQERVALARKSAGDIWNSIDDLELELLPEPEQIIRRYELGLLRLQDRLKEQGIFNDKDVQIALENYRRFLGLKQAADTEALEKRTAAEIEAGKQTARANADAFEREMERVLATLSSSFGFDLTGVDQIVSVGDKIAAAIDRNGGMR